MQKRVSKLFLLALTAALLWSFVPIHKFYVSHYTLEHRSNQLQITIKVFADDMEKAIQGIKPDIRLDERSKAEEISPLLDSYFQNHLKLAVKGKDIPIQLVGYELEHDLVWIYVKAEVKKAPQNLSVFCDALTEVYEDQINIFRVDCGSLKNTFALKKGDYKKEL